MMKDKFKTNSSIGVSTDPDSNNLLYPTGHFEENAGTSKISIIVLNENGMVLIAGRKKSPTSSNFDNEPFLTPFSDEEVRSAEQTTHGFVVVNGVMKETTNVQFIVMRGFSKDEKPKPLESNNNNEKEQKREFQLNSDHDGIFGMLKSNNIIQLIQQFGIVLEPKIHMSGECDSNLLNKDMKALVGQPLAGIKFNTKGNKSDRYKKFSASYNKLDPKVELPPPVMVSFIPEENIVLDKDHDKHVRLDSPKDRALYLANFIKRLVNGKDCEPSEDSAKENEDKTEISPTSSRRF